MSSRHPQTVSAVEEKSSSPEYQISCSESKATHGHSLMQMIPTSLCNTVIDLLHSEYKNVSKDCNMSAVCNDNKRTDDYQLQIIDHLISNFVIRLSAICLNIVIISYKPTI